ncbi:hypothetical protein LCGC14_1500400 [marine sediment metagenome]|uniref:Uncharacterized protein n=1 Tax=marine sediment metagenome TaxID=412755 RepID=A0A0F9LJY4_9ZZZZ
MTKFGISACKAPPMLRAWLATRPEHVMIRNPLMKSELGQILDDLLNLEEGLTKWEITFIDSLDHQRDAAHSHGRSWWLTVEQEEKLKAIAFERM